MGGVEVEEFVVFKENGLGQKVRLLVLENGQSGMHGRRYAAEGETDG